MNKKFLQSVVAGVMGLTLAASCSSLDSKKESNTCGAKNGCAAKKDEANKCSAKKAEAHKCSSVKAEATKEETKAVKKSKKSKKAKVVKSETTTETKTEEKSN
jgi:hypothetical protein